MNKLEVKTLATIAVVVVCIAAILFITAWTFAYWQAWAFLAVYFASALAISFYLMKADPKLLERRMSGGPAAEKQPAQRIIMTVTSLEFVGLLIVSGLDHRLAWSTMSPYVAIIGDVLVALGILGCFFVFRENTFSSSTIEIAPDHTVISSGPYALVRHPMYATALLMLVGMPVALGSWWGLLVTLTMILALVWRLFEEEKFLARNLAGYTEYQDKVRHRLIPNVW